MIGFGIAGCGAIAQAHIESILQIPHAKLVSVWNRTPERARATAEKYGCRWVEDYDDFVSDPDVDVVNVCTASGAHMELAVAAARAGKHLLIEKPLEVTTERCDAIIRACEEAGVKLGVIFPSRTSAANQDLKRRLNEGAFGRPIFASVAVPWYRTQEYYDSGDWRGTWELDGGGALMNQAIHNVDILQWLAGPVQEVKAYAERLVHERIEVEDTAVVILKFASGALGHILATTSLAPGYPVRLELHGTQAGYIRNGSDVFEWPSKEERPQASTQRQSANQPQSVSQPQPVSQSQAQPAATRPAGRSAANDPMAISFAGHQRLIEDMIDAIQNDREPMIPGHEGRKSVELITAAYRAARTGETIVIANDHSPS